MSEGAARLACAAHPEAAAVASCLVCGRLVCTDCRTPDADGLTRCPDCHESDATPGTPELTAEPPPQEPPASPAPRVLEEVAGADAAAATIAWERPDRFRDVEALWRSAADAFLSPSGFTSRVPWVRGDLRTPLIFAVLCAVIGQLGVLLFSLFGSQAAVPVDIPGLSGRPELVYRLLFMPMLPAFVTGMLFLNAWLGHALLSVAGAARRPFEATFRVYAYAHVASLALLVPVAGPYLENIYLVFLLLWGMRAAHGAGVGASLLALAPMVLQVLLLQGMM